jgi:hypothetical protein
LKTARFLDLNNTRKIRDRDHLLKFLLEVPQTVSSDEITDDQLDKMAHPGGIMNPVKIWFLASFET